MATQGSITNQKPVLLIDLTLDYMTTNHKFPYLGPVHEDDEPVVDGDDDVSLPDSALPGGTRLHHVVHDQVQALVLTETSVKILM